MELEPYYEPLTADQPCGENLEYDPDFIKLLTISQGKPERQMGDSIVPAEDPEWREVIKLACSLLERTRDIRIAVLLTRALTAMDGVIGLDQGLSLTNELLTRYWDEVYPQQDEDDDYPMERMNALTDLNSQGQMLRTMSHATLVEVKGIGRFSWRDVEIAEGKFKAGDDDTPAESNLIEAALMDGDRALLQEQISALQHAFEQAELIRTLCNERTVNNGPVLTAFINQLKQIHDYLLQHAPVDLEDDESEEGEEGSGKAGQPKQGINSREDVIRALDRVCDYYHKNEPSSPIPYLLRRAKKLAGMDFMEVLEEIASDGLNQAEKICGRREEP